MVCRAASRAFGIFFWQIFTQRPERKLKKIKCFFLCDFPLYIQTCIKNCQWPLFDVDNFWDFIDVLRYVASRADMWSYMSATPKAIPTFYRMTAYVKQPTRVTRSDQELKRCHIAFLYNESLICAFLLTFLNNQGQIWQQPLKPIVQARTSPVNCLYHLNFESLCK